MDYEIKDIGLADCGQLRIEWAERSMPVFRSIKKRFKKKRKIFVRGSGFGLSSCDNRNSQLDGGLSSQER